MMEIPKRFRENVDEFKDKIDQMTISELLKLYALTTVGIDTDTPEGRSALEDTPFIQSVYHYTLLRLAATPIDQREDINLKTEKIALEIVFMTAAMLELSEELEKDKEFNQSLDEILKITKIVYRDEKS